MSVSMSGKAIGSLTELIKNHILNAWDNSSGLPKPNVTIGRPEALEDTQGARLNIFLYQLNLDPFLRNTSLGPARPIPVWLVAKYILTAFDNKHESDTMDALLYLGEGIRILASLTTITLPQNISLPELERNPETLKLTIEDVGVELLSRIMQGPDQKYRSSTGFEIRPIMIESSSPPSYSLLVGMDYTKDPIMKIGEEGIKIDIESFFIQPVIVGIERQKFEFGETFYVEGKNLDIADLSIYLGSLELDIISQKKDILECKIDLSEIDDENLIVAGNYPIYLTQHLTGTKIRKSNIVIGSLIPKVDSATPNSLEIVADPITAQEFIKKGDIDILGNLLGRQNENVKDDVVAGLFRDGKTTNVLTEFTAIPSTQPGELPQRNVILHIQISDKVVPEIYRLIYTVNGQQAMNSPEVRLELP